ncbi:cdc42 effector protein 3 [Chanos chanos]|uniref:Cdc42 effector protein 3 n=1 Tax=Chanos chanos TaxID=29144 RepID=A0A6J2W2U7_CHACN|nr:cdc42 effector protein 3-like [Chanos chanos]
MPLRTSLHRKPSSVFGLRRLAKRKEVLSVNMISLPLGDFRHVSHISSDAQSDSFGDLSFLREGHNLLLQCSKSEQNLFLSSSPPPKPPRLNLDEPQSQGNLYWGEAHQHIIQRKKCSSLPLLDTEEEQEEDDQLGFEQIKVRGCPEQGSLSSGRDSTKTCPEESQQDEINSAYSFSLDLGPSILDDVLQVMEKLHE